MLAATESASGSATPENPSTPETKEIKGILKRKRPSSEEVTDIPTEGTSRKRQKTVRFFNIPDDAVKSDVHSITDKITINPYIKLLRGAQSYLKEGRTLESIDLIKQALSFLSERKLPDKAPGASLCPLSVMTRFKGHQDWKGCEAIRLFEIASKAFDKLIASPNYIDTLLQQPIEASTLMRWSASAIAVYDELGLSDDFENEEEELIYRYLSKLPQEDGDLAPAEPAPSEYSY